MNDLTLIYYSANIIPDYFAEQIRNQIVKAGGGNFPIISVTHKPLDFGDNICIGEVGPHVLTLYWQTLLGAKLAKTDYVAFVEDDCVYSPSHFTAIRPKTFAYNMNRYMTFTWEKNPLFSRKEKRHILSQLIAPRELYIEAMEERFAKTYTEERIQKHFSEPGRYEKWLGVTRRDKERFESKEPNVTFCHPYGLGFYKGIGIRKKHGDTRTTILEPYGNAKDFLKEYLGENEWIKNLAY